jgi:hypothetical protein
MVVEREPPYQTAVGDTLYEAPTLVAAAAHSLLTRLPSSPLFSFFSQVIL